MLNQYGPDLLMQCRSALDMSRELVKAWLEAYMFKERADRSERAEAVSSWLANHKYFKSHRRHISRTEVEKRQLMVFRLEEDETLQDLSLSVFHAATHTFTRTPAVKIIESHTGRAFIKQRLVQPRAAEQA